MIVKIILYAILAIVAIVIVGIATLALITTVMYFLHPEKFNYYEEQDSEFNQ